MNYFAHPQHLAYTWKGRVAFYAILKALGVGPGDEVILPAYTCVAVPSAVLYLGAVPVYADIEADTYTCSARTIQPHLTARTRVLVAQNTYGLSADLAPIMKLAEQCGVYVVEDCAHGLGSSYRGQPCGSVAHASFFSLQWSKPVSTGLGGVAYTPDPLLARVIQNIVARMRSCSIRDSLHLAAQRLLRPLAELPPLHYRLVDAYRQLTQSAGWIPGSSSSDELQATHMPPNFCRRMGRWHEKIFKAKLRHLPRRVAQRQKAAARLDELLREHQLEPPSRPSYAEHTMLRYPVRVANKSEVLAEARNLHIPLGDWFNSPLHPVQDNLQYWHYSTGTCPAAERACREVINFLPDTNWLLPRQRIGQLLQGAAPVEHKLPQVA